MPQYSWKKKFFSSTTNLYLDNDIIGNFAMGIFMKTYIELLGNTYTVKMPSIWANNFGVYKNEEKTPIATLQFNFWGSSTKITYNHMIYEMVYRSIFHNHFNLYHQNKSIYTYDASKLRGYIKTTKQEDPLLIILGLYCHVRRRRNN